MLDEGEIEGEEGSEVDKRGGKMEVYRQGYVAELSHSPSHGPDYLSLSSVPDVL